MDRFHVVMLDLAASLERQSAAGECQYLRLFLTEVSVNNENYNSNLSMSTTHSHGE